MDFSKEFWYTKNVVIFFGHHLVVTFHSPKHKCSQYPDHSSFNYYVDDLPNNRKRIHLECITNSNPRPKNHILQRWYRIER
uniref:Immunoglobulin containing protein n=1 Tax=Clytia hemisphaerica TaxID=252671 RepID=A0A069DMQ5_9CNID